MTILNYLIATFLIIKIVRFLFKKKSKKHRKSILGKIWVLLSMRLHRKLDGMIIDKKKSLTNTIQKPNIVEFKVYKGKKIQ